MAQKIKTTKKGIDVFRLENENLQVELLSYGAIIAKLLVKDKNGRFVDVVAGYQDEDEYLNDTCYFGACIGRVCNRIGKAEFELDGKKYALAKNDGNNHLHGGLKGFNARFFDAQVGENFVKFSRVSQGGEEGYPGSLNLSVTYTLKGGALEIEYEATSDADTVCSLTNHSYFNLDGDFESVLEHEVFIDANFLTDIDEELIPHGDLLALKGTPYDFSTPKEVGKDIKADDRLLKIARGYDFNFVFNKGGIDKVRAYAYSKKSGIKMDVLTDRPCVQLYTGNFLDGVKGKKTYGFQSALCLETQGYPNAVNVPTFESVVLEKGNKYNAKTIYAFSLK